MKVFQLVCIHHSDYGEASNTTVIGVFSDETNVTDLFDEYNNLDDYNSYKVITFEMDVEIHTPQVFVAYNSRE